MIKSDEKAIHRERKNQQADKSEIMSIFFVFILVIAFFAFVQSFTPLVPTHGYTYVIEANRDQAWPSCAYRFLSFASNCQTVDLWNAAGGNQYWTLISTGDSDGSFYVRATCGAYLSYTSNCDDKSTIDLWPQAGINQKFRFVKGNNGQFEYYMEAVGRAQCAYKYLSFPVGCTTSSPDHIDFWSDAGPDQRFRLYPVTSVSPVVHDLGSAFACADPYAWKPRKSSNYLIQCTGGGLKLGYLDNIDSGKPFTYEGDCLGGNPAGWAAESAWDSRWAPENYESPDSQWNYLFFSDTQPDGLHRIGWVSSENGPNPNQYTHYASSYMNLGNAPGGDIDGTIFEDPSNGHTYLIWKTDDNNVGSKTTRIWLQELSFNNGSVSMVGGPRVIMDSTGLWWIDSWINGGSLVEGPEVIKYGSYYYLFFAAGKFCQDTYTEGVARSTSLFGPYEKMKSPVLSNGIVGVGRMSSTSTTQQLVGPGHASLVKMSDGSYRIVYHASVGENCNRYSFINKIAWTADAWPYANF
jgi:GH43 family beta-xylosidase